MLNIKIEVFVLILWKINLINLFYILIFYFSIDQELFLSNRSISKRENQCLNKEVLSILNASLDVKNNNKSQQNINSIADKNENTYNEISSIEQGSSYNEFSQTYFSLAMDKKESDFLYNCISFYSFDNLRLFSYINIFWFLYLMLFYFKLF